MTLEYSGKLNGENVRICIVVSRFNEFVTSRLLAGAKSALNDLQVRQEDVTVVWVPGAFELPMIAKRMAESQKYYSVVCLGDVIKGETDHYDFIASQAARGIADAASQTNVPVIFGVLTTNTVEQAINRSGGESGQFAESPRPTDKSEPLRGSSKGHRGNSGYNAAVSAVEMANLCRQIEPE